MPNLKSLLFLLESPADLNNPAYQSERLKIGFDLKKTIKLFWLKKLELRPPFFDLGAAFWLTDPDLKNYSPKFLFKKFFKSEWKNKISERRLLFDYVRRQLEEKSLSKVFREIEMPLLPILAEMENTGIKLSSQKLKKLEKIFDQKLRELTEKAYQLAGRSFNLNSSQQLSRLLFEELKINSSRIFKTSGGQRSTAVENLEPIKNQHPIIPLIIEYREIFKIQSTYIRPFQRLLRADNRIHTEFIQTGTATGRLSSQNPNLQNIPSGSHLADELRAAFEAEKGFTLVGFDYSQIELRILAHLSRDPKLIEAFQKGLDIHRATAAGVFKVPLEKVTSDMRQLAKTLNFGLIYGMGTAVFSRTSGLNQDQAKKFIEAYFQEFKNVRVYQEEVRGQARMFGYVQTLTGRRRYFTDIISLAPRAAAEAERAAINQPIQGLAADILKLAMIRIKEILTKEGCWNRTARPFRLAKHSGQARLLLSIHDELLFEINDDKIKKITPVIKEIMENIYPLIVPLKIEIAVGKNWRDLEKYETNQ